MYKYKITEIAKALKEACKRFVMTRNLSIKKVKFIEDKEHYLVTLSDGSEHIVPQELINRYIETLGDEGARKIATALIHSIELEQSALSEPGSDSDDFWDGDIRDALDYLDEQDKGV